MLTKNGATKCKSKSCELPAQLMTERGNVMRRQDPQGGQQAPEEI